MFSELWKRFIAWLNYLPPLPPERIKEIMEECGIDYEEACMSKDNPNERRHFNEEYGMTYNCTCPDCKKPTFASERRGSTLFVGKCYYHDTEDKIVGVIGGLKGEVYCEKCATERGILSDEI